MKSPLVSVIVTTRNNHETLDACLRSVAAQAYSPIELIVVDNNSSDDTKAIAKRYTSHVYDKGPERSAQRNYAFTKTKGEYILVIDSDMELDPNVIASCMFVMLGDPKVGGVIIPEESFGEGFWAQCKRLERSFYVGQDAIEAARFFTRDAFVKAGGYSEEMTGGEDWDLSRRVAAIATIGRATDYIRHNEGRLYFGKTASKMYYYAQHAVEYFAKNPTKSALTDQSGPLQRYKLFFSRPDKLLRHPILSVGMLALKTSEYACGGLGYYRAKRALRNQVVGDAS